MVNPTFPFLRFQAVAQNQIERYGRDAVLRRVGSPDVSVRAVVLEFQPNEHQRLRTDPLDRKVLLAATDSNGHVIAEPNKDKDRLILWQVDPVLAGGVAAQPLTIDQNLSIVQIAGR